MMTIAAEFENKPLPAVGNLSSFSNLDYDGIVTPLADSDATSITANSIGKLPLLPSLDDDAQLDSSLEGFDKYLDNLPYLDDLPHLDDLHHQLLLDTVDTNFSLGLQDEVSPLLEPLSSPLPCPSDKIDDEDVTTVMLLSHYLFNHFFNGQKCTNCSAQVISQQSGQCNYCRMCFKRMQSEVTKLLRVVSDSSEEWDKAIVILSESILVPMKIRTILRQIIEKTMN